MTTPECAVEVAESRFLRSLPDDLQFRLQPDLETVDLALGDIVMSAGVPMSFVYFPTSCLISLVVKLKNGNTIEATTVGNNGFVDISAFLGLAPADMTGMVQVAGEALRMDVGAFRKHASDARLNERLAQFASFTLSGVAQSIACIAYHPVQQRLARWLLQVRDGLERDEFVLTQEFLAVMLGVHRPTVTIASQALQDAELIEYSRGRIRVLNVEGLSQAACECYRSYEPLQD